MDIISLVKSRLGDTYDLHRRYINPQFVRVLQVIGFERNYTTAKGAWLKDEKGAEVLDFLAGFGVFNIGRNHPLVARVLHDMLDSDPASMVQMDVGTISGLLAEALASLAPGDLEAVFFTNSGAEGVEAALKFARQATGRSKLVYCDHAFHGLTLGALSVNGNEEFRGRNEPLLPDCIPVPFNDPEALEAALSGGMWPHSLWNRSRERVYSFPMTTIYQGPAVCVTNMVRFSLRTRSRPALVAQAGCLR